MSSHVNIKTRTNIISTETATTILRGQAVTAWGKLAVSPVGVAGVAEDEAAPGVAIPVVTGRCWIKNTGTPAAEAELTVDANGNFAAAVATNTVVGYQLEPVRTDPPDLAIGWIEPAAGYAKA